MSRMRLSCLALVAVLAGCAGVGTFHNACLEGNRAFADEVACVRANVAQSSLRSNTLVQEYLMTGDLLVQQVRRGEISEDQARLQFTRKLNEIKKTEAEIAAAQARADRATWGWGWGSPYYSRRCRYDPFHPFCWP